MLTISEVSKLEVEGYLRHIYGLCYAKDNLGNNRGFHKPTVGKYADKPVVSCAWCGKTLREQMETQQ